MTITANVASNPSEAASLLRDDEMDAVSGGVFGVDDVIAITIAVAGGALIGYWAGSHQNQGGNCSGSPSPTPTPTPK